MTIRSPRRAGVACVDETGVAERADALPLVLLVLFFTVLFFAATFFGATFFAATFFGATFFGATFFGAAPCAVLFFTVLFFAGMACLLKRTPRLRLLLSREREPLDQARRAKRWGLRRRETLAGSVP